MLPVQRREEREFKEEEEEKKEYKQEEEQADKRWRGFFGFGFLLDIPGNLVKRRKRGR